MPHWARPGNAVAEIISVLAEKPTIAEMIEAIEDTANSIEEDALQDPWRLDAGQLDDIRIFRAAAEVLRAQLDGPTVRLSKESLVEANKLRLKEKLDDYIVGLIGFEAVRQGLYGKSKR
jgi:hypothetical protein